MLKSLNVNDTNLIREAEDMRLYGNYLVFDTEDINGVPYMFGVRTSDGYKKFDNAFDAIRFIQSRKEGYVLAFNLSYDAFNLFGYKVFDLEPLFINGRLAFFRLGKQRFIDAYNHWPISIADAGDLIGLNKLEAATYKKRVSVKYNERDCDIAYLFVDEMLKRYDKDNIPFKLTIASSSLAHYLNLTGIMPEISHFYNEYYAAYFGGRCECFKLGKFNKAYQYDINSMYPYVMTKEFPYPLNVIKKPCIDKEGITKALFKSDMEVPVLPFRDEKKNVYFCNGEFIGTYCNNEIRHFINNGGKVVKIIDGIHFKKTERIFKNYVLEFYNKRLNAKSEFEKYYYKLFLNSLYGKFAQRAFKQRLIDLSKAEKYNGEIIGDKLLVISERERPYYSNVIWSAYVTAYARIYLHGFLKKYFSSLLYADTDSFMLTEKLPIEMLSNNLGGIKLERCGKAEIIAPKMYSIENKIVVKGVPKRAVKKLVNEYTYEKPVKLLEGLRRGLRPNKWVKVTKTLTGTIRNKNIKGNVLYPKKILDK